MQTSIDGSHGLSGLSVEIPAAGEARETVRCFSPEVADAEAVLLRPEVAISQDYRLSYHLDSWSVAIEHFC